MPRLRVNVPVWLDRDARAGDVRFPTLTRHLDVDIAVVGGGATGAAVAWRFADAGLRVALVEAARIGRGSTSASTALLMQEPDEDFSVLSRRYGRARARRIWELSRDSTRELVQTLARLAIACDLVARDSVYYTATDDDERTLRDEFRRRRSAGIRGRWLPRRTVRR